MVEVKNTPGTTPAKKPGINMVKILVLMFLCTVKPLRPETRHSNFLSVAYFLVHPIEKCCQLSLLQEEKHAFALHWMGSK